MLVSLFLVCLKYVGLLLLAFVAYMVAFKVIPPYLVWLKYKKYKNVHTSKSFIPLLGDFWPIMKNLKAGIKYYNHLDQKVYDMKDQDIELMFEGDKPCFQIFSHQAHKEFEELIPHKIDRFPEEEHIGQMVHKTIGNVRFDKLFNFRKRTVLKLLSIGRSSLYIPRMIKSCEWLTNTWKGDPCDVNCSKDMFKLNFNVFIKVLLGEDNLPLVNTPHPYENEDGSTTMMTLGDYTLKTSDAFIDQFLNPLSIIFPFINKYQLCEPFKRNHRNLKVLQDWLKKAIDNCQDELSMLYALKDLKEIPPDVLLDDLVGYILAGADTSAHGFCATLYQLKKNPEKLVKLMDELKSHGFTKDSNMDEALSWEKIDQLDYLNWCLKEGLRIDPPGVDSLGYECVEDVTLCGVPFKKGQYMKINLYASNHSPVEHQRPHDFIPERFDPESEFFTKPNSNKASSPYSNIPFSHGPRGCPGLVIAMMQIKVAFVYILSKYDYEIEPETLKKEGMGFALRSGIELHAKFTKK